MSACGQDAQLSEGESAVTSERRIRAFADTFIHSGRPTQNFGSAATLLVKQTSNDDATRVALLEFPLGGVSGAVQSASLRVYGRADRSGAQLSLRPLNGSFEESRARWQGRPSWGDQQASLRLATSDRWQEVDVTALVRAARSSGELRLALLGQTRGDYFQISARESNGRGAELIVRAETGSSPTPSSRSPVADAWTHGGEPSRNYGSATWLKVKQGSASSTRIAYLRFNKAGLSAGARLSLFGRTTHTAAQRLDVHRVSGQTGRWEEGRINHNNRPGLGARIGSVTLRPGSGRRVTLDLGGASGGSEELLELALVGGDRGTIFEIGSKENAEAPRLEGGGSAPPPPSNPGPTNPSPTNPVDQDAPWGGRFLGFPLGGGANHPVKVGGRRETSTRRKWDDARLGLRIQAQRSGRVLGIMLRNRATDRDRPNDSCGGGYAGLYCRREGEYSVGDGGRVIGELRESGGADPTRWQPGRRMTTVRMNGGLQRPLVDHILNVSEYVYWAFSSPVNLQAGRVYYLELRQSSTNVDEYVGFNLTRLKEGPPPISDPNRGGPLQTNWEAVATGNGRLSIDIDALPSYQLVYQVGNGRRLVGPNQVYAEGDVPVIGGSRRMKMRASVTADATLQRLWVQVNSFPSGRPSQPLIAEVWVNGQRRFSGSFNAGRFPRNYAWASLSIPGSIRVRRGQTVELVLRSNQARWAIRRFDQGKWFNKLDRRAGLNSKSAVQSAMVNASYGQLFESENGGRSWSTRANRAIPLALELR